MAPLGQIVHCEAKGRVRFHSFDQFMVVLSDLDLERVLSTWIPSDVHIGTS